MGILGDIADFFGLGGGGGSSVNYGVTSTIQGGSTPVGLVSTVQGGSTPVGLVSTIQGGTRDVGLDVGLDDVNIDIGGTDTPLHTITDINVPLPIRSEVDTDSDIRSRLDIEPIQADLCIDVGLTKLPKAHISQPYDSHFGVTVWGAEILGFNWIGQSNIVIDELSHRPHIEPGGRPGGHLLERPTHRRRLVVGRDEDGGLHIRLD